MSQSTEAEKLTNAIHKEVHGTIWDLSEPITAENLPAWWLVDRKHHADQIKRLGHDCDRLLLELQKEDPSAFRVMELKGDVDRALGRVHGILGRLPVYCHIPTEISRKHNQASAGASIWLQKKLGVWPT